MSLEKQTIGYWELSRLEDPRAIMNTYFRGLIRRNPSKYASYVHTIKWIIPLILRLPWTVKNAHKILPLTYAVCRIIDDYIDGDFRDVWDSDKIVYINNRLRFLDASISWIQCSPESPEDTIFRMMFSLTHGEDTTRRIQMATKRIVQSMLFDAERLEKYKQTWDLEFPKAQDLFEHFTLMDVLWTGDGLSALIRLWDGTAESVRSVGIACRIEYTLHDLPDDIRVWIINISKEDAQKYGITTAHLKAIQNLPPIRPIDPKNPSLIFHQDVNKYPKGVCDWIRAQVEEYEKIMSSVSQEEIEKLSFHARFFYRFAYKQPSDKVIAQLKAKFTHA